MTLGTFLAGPVGSWLRVALAAALSLWLIDLTQDGFTFDWESYGIAFLVSLLPPIIAYLNPQDPRFGTNKEV